MPLDKAQLQWVEWVEFEGTGSWRDAILKNPDDSDGVRLSLAFQGTCHRRGRWKLLVEVLPGKDHHCWGCFDSADQPMRYYHDEGVALAEAQRIADVLMTGYEESKSGVWTPDPKEFATAPWTEDQIASLNGYQSSGVMHPFTGVDQHGNKVDLIATEAGWIADSSRDVVQEWAHKFMADWSWVPSWLSMRGEFEKRAERLRKAYEVNK